MCVTPNVIIFIFLHGNWDRTFSYGSSLNKEVRNSFFSHSQPFYVGRTAVGCGQNETVVDDTPSTREDRKLGAILVGTNWNKYKLIDNLDQFIPENVFILTVFAMGLTNLELKG